MKKLCCAVLPVTQAAEVKSYRWIRTGALVMKIQCLFLAVYKPK